MSTGYWLVNELKPRPHRLFMKFEIHRASGGQYYWRIVAGNGQVLAVSETYYNKRDAQAAAEIVQRGAADARIFDHT
jgi:uncharacterized protein